MRLLEFYERQSWVLDLALSKSNRKLAETGEALFDDKYINIAGFFPTRVRRKDLPLAVLFGVAFWMINAWLLYQLRFQMSVLDNQGQRGQHPYTDPERVLAGLISHVILVLFMAHLQVDERGIPAGLTVKRALLPVIVFAAFAFGTLPIITDASGSLAYASIAVAIGCVTTLGISLALRKVRQLL